MEAVLLLGGQEMPVLLCELSLKIVLKTQDQEALLLRHRHMDQPLLRVLDLHLALDGIVQSIAEDVADVHRIHKGKQRAVGHAGEGDAVFRTVQALRGQHHIQHAVARLVLGLVLPDLLLHAAEIGLPLPGILFAAEVGDLMLQVMVLVVDELNAFLGLHVLGILILEHRLHGFQLRPHPKLRTLHEVSKEDGQTAAVHQHPGDAQLIGGKSLCRSGISHKADVADGKNRRRDDDAGEQLLPVHRHLSVLRQLALQQTIEAEYDPGIDQQKQQAAERHSRQLPRRDPADQLPLRRGHKLRQHEGQGAEIEGVPHRNLTAEIQKGQHESDRREHAGEPEHQRHIIRCHQKTALRQKEHRRNDARLPWGIPPPEMHNEHKTGQPFRQRRVDPGNVRYQLRPRHFTTSPQYSVRASINSFRFARLRRSFSPRTMAQPS